MLLALNCTLEPVRKPLVNQVIPQCLGWDKALGGTRRKEWLLDIWTCCRLSSHRTDLSVQDMFGVLCRTFDHFLGIEDQAQFLEEVEKEKAKASEAEVKDAATGSKGKKRPPPPAGVKGKGQKTLAGAAPARARVAIVPKFPCTHDLRADPAFWRLVTSGLLSPDTVTRKRCLYLLHRAVAVSANLLAPEIRPGHDVLFFWLDDLSALLEAAWDKFFLLFDTLEETASHLIEPVWNHLLALIPAQREDYVTPPLGYAYLHPGWWSLLLRRCLGHEILAVKKTALREIMNINLERHGSILGEWDFVFEVLLPGIDDSEVYASQGASYSESLFLDYLSTFLRLVYDACDTAGRVRFLQRHVRTIHARPLTITLFVHLARFLGELPAVPSLGSDDLNLIRELFVEVRTRSSTVKRRLAQWYVLRALFNLLDPAQLSYADIRRFLEIFPGDDLVVLGNEHWLAVSGWFPTAFAPKGGIAGLVRTALADIEEASAVPLQEDSFVARTGDGSRILGLALHQDPSLFPSVAEYVGTKVLSPSKDTQTKGLFLLADLVANIHLPKCEFLRKYVAPLPGVIDAVRAHLTTFLFASNGHDSARGSLIVSVLGNVLTALWEADASLASEMAPVVEREMFAHLRALANTPKTWVRLMGTLQTLEALRALLLTGFLRGDRAELFTLLQTISLVRPQTMSIDQVADWSVFEHHFSRLKWQSCYLLLRLRLGESPVTLTAVEVLDVCTPGLLSTSSVEVFPIFECLQVALELDTSTVPLESWETLIETTWKMVVDMARTGRTHLQLLNTFTKLVFHHQLLRIPELNGPKGLVRRMYHEVMATGETRPGVANFVARPLCSFWALRTPEALAHLRSFHEEFLQLLIYGPVRKENATEARSTEILVSNLQKQEEVPESVAQDSVDREHCVRVAALDVLLHLDAADPAQRELGFSLFFELLERNNEQPFCNSRAYDNSQEHRHKIRLWQAILVLEPFLGSDEEAAGRALDTIHRLYETQDNLVSIRVLVEWVTLKLFLRAPSHVPKIFSWLGEHSVRQQVACSYISLAFHLARSLPPTHILAHLPAIVNALLPWPISHQHVPRLMSLDALLKIAGRCRLDPTLPQEVLPMIGHFERFLQGNDEYVRHLAKFDTDYMFQDLEPELDFTIDFIFHRFILLSKVTEDEIIPVVCLSLFLLGNRGADFHFAFHSAFLQISQQDDAKMCGL